MLTIYHAPGARSLRLVWLCEEMGAMCIGADTIGLEVLPSEEKDVFLPVHAYMFATAGAQIIEVVNLEELNQTKTHEFLLILVPMRIRGGTASPVRPLAVV